MSKREYILRYAVLWMEKLSIALVLVASAQHADL